MNKFTLDVIFPADQHLYFHKYRRKSSIQAKDIPNDNFEILINTIWCHVHNYV